MSAANIARNVSICVLTFLFSGLSLLCLAQSLSRTSPHTTVRKVEKKRPQDTPETLLGERLFLETRFSQYFAAYSNGEVNRPLANGDPVVAQVKNPRAGVSYPSPFAGRSINCRSCHFVDEFTSLIGGVNRTYCDFLPRTPIPDRGDGQTVTIRNSRNMVDDFPPHRAAILLHGDGEFANVNSLVEGTLTGRDMGWLPDEQSKAIHHVAKVIREDDGRDDLGQQYGGSYAKLMMGSAPDIPDQFRLASDFRIDVSTASDPQIFNEVARLISAYLDSLRLERTAEGIHSGSAYDMFLAKNNLPAQPAPGESDVEYSQRLLQKLDELQNPKFVMAYERWLRFHPHVAQFGKQELTGLKLFLRQSARQASNSHSDTITHAGNCFRCHPAPEFTDTRFHNTGAAQEEYDSVHGAGSFAQLPVPSYGERSRHPDRYLPATPSHPHATGIFRSIPTSSNVSATDLGMWNVFANPDYPEVQSQMRRMLCGNGPCDPKLQLPRTIALFRTPGLRDLGHSAPYLHTGRLTTVEDVLHFYSRISALARDGRLRNPDPELSRISLDEQDVAALAAFLRSLDEDYDN